MLNPLERKYSDGFATSTNPESFISKTRSHWSAEAVFDGSQDTERLIRFASNVENGIDHVF